MKPRVVIVVCDSLGAELVQPDVAPALCALRQASADYANARGVFPSTTRTSVASLATGCLPAQHGLLGNTMVLDEGQGQGLTCLSVGKPGFLQRLRQATGRTLRRPTLAERVARHGGCVVMSNVSPGAAYLHDPDGHGHVYHRSGSFGPGLQPLGDGLAVEVGMAGDAAMTERFCAELLRGRRPALAVLWLSEPDHTAHRSALGSPRHRQAIAAADRCVGRVREALAAPDPQHGQTLLIACADHGMQTVRRQIDLVNLLVQAGFKAGPDSRDVVVAPNGSAALLYLAPAALPRLQPLADWLRAQDWAGRVLTGPALAEVGLPLQGEDGTPAPALALALRSDDEPNAFGVRGHSDTVASPFSSESAPGCAQHGGLGRREQHPFLYLHGGGFAPGVRTQPASLIDIAPTVLRHLGLARDGMQGAALA